MRIFTIGAMAILMATAASAQDDDNIFEIDPRTIDVGLLLNCAVDVPTYNTFALSLEDEKYGSKARGWVKQDLGNPFLAQYRLPRPIDVIGGVTETYTTQTIVFTSSAILAVLDLPDPTELADSMQINDIVPGPSKFMGERIVEQTEKDDADLGFRVKTTITQSVSTVSSHPGKSLVGCSYRNDLTELGKKK